MLTCSIAYESNDHTNGEVASVLINGFSGSLKMWWDHALTSEQREAIKRYKTKVKRVIKVDDENVTPLEIEEECEDAVEVLLYTINRHFLSRSVTLI